MNFDVVVFTLPRCYCSCWIFRTLNIFEVGISVSHLTCWVQELFALDVSYG